MNSTSELLHEVSQKLFNKDRPDSHVQWAIMSTEIGRYSSKSWSIKAIMSYMSRHKGFDGSNDLSKACSLLLSDSKADVTPSTIIHKVGMKIPKAIMITKDPRRCTCGTWFMPNMHNHKYCSKKCKNEARSR